MAESKSDAEALIPQFNFERLLNQGVSTRPLNIEISPGSYSPGVSA